MSLYKVPFLTEELEENMVIAETFYFDNEEGVNMLFSRPGTRLTDRHIEKLKQHRVQQVLIFSNTPPVKPIIHRTAAEQQEIDAKAKKIIQYDENITEVRSVIKDDLRDRAIESIRNLFDATKEAVGQGENMTTAYQVIKDLDEVVYQLVYALATDSKELVHINNLKSYDEYTYHHSLSVAVLSVAIGQAMELEEQKLKSLCLCAVLHDIGKTMVPVELILKPERLNADEFEIVKMHATYGSGYLKNGAIGGMELWLGVAFHHEKFNGNGYPKRLKKSEIPLYSRIIAVADVYDAVTSHRPYRSPMIPCDALEMILYESGGAFDPEVVEAFKQKLELYPINTIVEFSDNREGIVVDNTNARRPIVKMLHDGEIVDLADLSNMNVVIKSVKSKPVPREREKLK